MKLVSNFRGLNSPGLMIVVVMCINVLSAVGWFRFFGTACERLPFLIAI